MLLYVNHLSVPYKESVQFKVLENLTIQSSEPSALKNSKEVNVTVPPGGGVFWIKLLLKDASNRASKYSLSY